MKEKKCPVDEKQLYNEYINLGIKGLCVKYMVTKATIWKWLKKYNIQRIGRIYSREDLSGKKFGYLTAIRYCHWKEFNTSKSKTMWLCECECGKFRLVDSYDLTHNKIISCGCKNGERLYSGIGDLSGTYYNACKKGALQRNLEFSVSKEFLWNLFLKQNKKCALTDLDIQLQKHYKLDYQNQTASLDRIDSSKGYIEGNVQWVHRDVNFLKGNRNEEYLYDICLKICNKLGEKYGKNN